MLFGMKEGSWIKVGSKLTVIDNLCATFDRVSSDNTDVGITL